MLFKRREEHGRKLMKRSCGKTESWLLGGLHAVETSKEEVEE
jgi:hypothetical protein